MTTPLIIKAGETLIPAVLNDTVAAKDFKKHLPFRVSGFKSPVDYCCSAACGIFDPTETQSGWKNGDISLAGGWFAILFDGQESSADYRNMMIIAHIDEENLDLIRGLPEHVKFSVDIA